MPAIEKLADDRSQLIYDAIDGSGGFYRGPVDRHCRSKMNVVWRLPTEDLEKKFVDEAKAKGMVGLKGHRSVGGCRASIYNAMPLAGAQALASFMADFVKANG
jgi:phosphoserine aminotransferase